MLLCLYSKWASCGMYKNMYDISEELEAVYMVVTMLLCPTAGGAR